MSRKTDALLKNILSAKDFNEVLSANSEAFVEKSISEYLQDLC